MGIEESHFTSTSRDKVPFSVESLATFPEDTCSGDNFLDASTASEEADSSFNSSPRIKHCGSAPSKIGSLYAESQESSKLEESFVQSPSSLRRRQHRSLTTSQRYPRKSGGGVSFSDNRLSHGDRSPSGQMPWVPALSLIYHSSKPGTGQKSANTNQGWVLVLKTAKSSDRCLGDDRS